MKDHGIHRLEEQLDRSCVTGHFGKDSRIAIIMKSNVRAEGFY